MKYLYIMWLYVFRFVACKVSVGAFSLLYSKLLLAKLCLFVFGATFAESHSNLISIGSCFIRDGTTMIEWSLEKATMIDKSCRHSTYDKFEN